MTHNFNGGPSILPPTVFQQASEAILNFNNSGLSILEIGHRTDRFEAVLHEAIALVKELMQLNADREVLFLHGGASTQFMQVPMNLLNAEDTSAYIDNGVWGTKAIKEAKVFGKVDVVSASKDKNYTYIGKEFILKPGTTYLHYTTNNTIEGTQWHTVPQTGEVPLVADMSSDILSCTMDFNQFDLIYAGAQKNIGAAGVNLLVINKNILGKVNRPIPTIMDYRQHIANGSMLNTPPVFAIYVSMLTLRWLKEQGGVPAIEAINNQKAALLYETIDVLPMFTGTVAHEDRSKMNVVFVMEPALEKAFLEECKKENLYGVKGHRSVGGFRASLYNALPLSSVQVLCQLMNHFAQRHG
jgi:phosphoserine aminotransferase